jgi:hypothetical protein
MDFTFVLQKGYVYARIDYFHPFTGTEFRQYIESPQIFQEIEDMMHDEQFYYESFIADESKEHYIVEYLMGRDLDTANRKTVRKTRYYNEQPTRKEQG